MRIERAYYSATIQEFLTTSTDEVIGIIVSNVEYSMQYEERFAWEEEIALLKQLLPEYEGKIYLEYSIPRMGKRIDVLLVIANAIFVIEFKVGERHYQAYAIDQVWDYALDLKNFHETSHHAFIVPILVSTRAKPQEIRIIETLHNDNLPEPILCNTETLSLAIRTCLDYSDADEINIGNWESGRYYPTPTIVEAATVLYQGHSVENISRSDASAINLAETSDALSRIIEESKQKGIKSICFVTGVPGAGKTLVGLNIANKFRDPSIELHSVFLSGNGPLVRVLIEALTRDDLDRRKAQGEKVRKKDIEQKVKSFIQIIHHYRDSCIKDPRPPIDHVSLFDEAQRAWNIQKTADFMSRKKNRPDFRVSEPEFLISCLDRHKDWAVIVCLVGGGQEIYLGEAGIGEWIEALDRSYPDWHVYISPRLEDAEYSASGALNLLKGRDDVYYMEELHLAVSLRSFRAENVSDLVKNMLDMEVSTARETLRTLEDKYPIVITRDLHKAKKWLKEHARGSERYGLVASSQAIRLKPHAIFVKQEVDPIHWFLNEKDDIRSSYYLEDVATEFMIQGLELDWVCVTWDADLRIKDSNWEHWEFKGSKWNHILMAERQMFLKNAYRVLLTRARQGMVIFIPPGDQDDPTRPPQFYDPLYEYLCSIGFETI